MEDKKFPLSEIHSEMHASVNSPFEDAMMNDKSRRKPKRERDRETSSFAIDKRSGGFCVKKTDTLSRTLSLFHAGKKNTRDYERYSLRDKPGPWLE